MFKVTLSSELLFLFYRNKGITKQKCAHLKKPPTLYGETPVSLCCLENRKGESVHVSYFFSVSACIMCCLHAHCRCMHIHACTHTRTLTHTHLCTHTQAHAVADLGVGQGGHPPALYFIKISSSDVLSFYLLLLAANSYHQSLS